MTILRKTIWYILFIYGSGQAQNLENKFNFSAYGEFYYSYDFSKPPNHEKSFFLYNHKRHNELNANLILVKANYDDSNTRANLGLMLGNYAQYNLSAEPTWGQFIYEANVGIKLFEKQNIWFDAGVFPSHIGFESAIGADNWTLTRSIVAENSPYFETGLKGTYTNPKNNLTISVLALNGWQRIQKPTGIQRISGGLQLNYKPTDLLTLNYSNFVGTDKPDDEKSIRLYQNFYAQYQGSQRIAFIAGFDFGNERYKSTWLSSMFSPVLITQFTLNQKTKLALRAEHYQDKKGVIISDGLELTGFSSNIDYQINPNSLLRFEAKMYQSSGSIFNNKNQNYSICSSLCIHLK